MDGGGVCWGRARIRDRICQRPDPVYSFRALRLLAGYFKANNEEFGARERQTEACGDRISVVSLVAEGNRAAQNDRLLKASDGSLQVLRVSWGISDGNGWKACIDFLISVVACKNPQIQARRLTRPLANKANNTTWRKGAKCGNGTARVSEKTRRGGYTLLHTAVEDRAFLACKTTRHIGCLEGLYAMRCLRCLCDGFVLLHTSAFRHMYYKTVVLPRCYDLLFAI